MHEPTLPRDLHDAIRAVAVDDVERTALADLLGDLAADPLPPDELTARRHIRAMCEAGGAVEPRVTARRRRGGRVRVVAAGWIAAATVLGGAGVAAATGSLPGPIQHAVAGVTHAVGIDIPGAPHHHPNPHGPRGANGGSSDHRGTRSGSGDPATQEGTPGASAPARGSGASGVTTAPSTAPPAGAPSSAGAPATGNGASASSPGHGATPPGQGGTPPGQVTNPGQGNGNSGNNGSGNANGQGNGNGASASSPGHGATPPGQGGTPPGQQKKASGA